MDNIYNNFQYATNNIYKLALGLITTTTAYICKMYFNNLCLYKIYFQIFETIFGLDLVMKIEVLFARKIYMIGFNAKTKYVCIFFQIKDIYYCIFYCIYPINLYCLLNWFHIKHIHEYFFKHSHLYHYRNVVLIMQEPK